VQQVPECDNTRVEYEGHHLGVGSALVTDLQTQTGENPCKSAMRTCIPRARVHDNDLCITSAHKADLQTHVGCYALVKVAHPHLAQLSSTLHSCPSATA
jgi:hypothetical protein